MRQKFTVILKKVKSTDSVGYLRISFRENKKTRLISIPNLAPIQPNQWNKKNQVVKSNFTKYKEYNAIIEEELRRIISENSVETNTLSDRMLIATCRDIIKNNYNKHSTQTRYNYYIVMFENFIISTMNKVDLPIVSINPNFFDKYLNHESARQDRISPNTIKTSISVLKLFLKKITKTYGINFSDNFFNEINTPKSIQVKRKILSPDDFKKIYFTKMEDKKSEETRLIFLFSAFSNGLRWSDAATLQYKDFTITHIDEKIEIRFMKFQRKTRRLINTFINDKSAIILSKFLPTGLLSPEIIERLEYFSETDSLIKEEKNKQDFTKIKLMFSIKLENEILRQHIDEREITASIEDLLPLKNSYIESLKIKYRSEGIDDVTISTSLKNNEHLIYFNELISYIEESIKVENVNKIRDEKNLNQQFYNLIAEILIICKANYPFVFVFPLLNSEDFADIKTDDGFSNPTATQEKKLHVAITNYNKRLETLCRNLNIPKISSHFARNSFGTLLNDNDGLKSIDMLSLKEAMGHATVAQSEKYVQIISTSVKDGLTKRVSDLI